MEKNIRWINKYYQSDDTRKVGLVYQTVESGENLTLCISPRRKIVVPNTKVSDIMIYVYDEDIIVSTQKVKAEEGTIDLQKILNRIHYDVKDLDSKEYQIIKRNEKEIVSIIDDYSFGVLEEACYWTYDLVHSISVQFKPNKFVIGNNIIQNLSYESWSRLKSNKAQMRFLNRQKKISNVHEFMDMIEILQAAHGSILTWKSGSLFWDCLQISITLNYNSGDEPVELKYKLDQKLTEQVSMVFYQLMSAEDKQSAEKLIYKAKLLGIV